MIKIYDTDTHDVIAKKMWDYLDVGDFVVVRGLVLVELVMESKGDLVLRELERLDTETNFYVSKGKKNRKYKFKNNSVGGPIAHKIFTFDKKVVEKEPRVTIWRFQ